MKVLLTSKLAQWGDGIDLRAANEGQVIDLPDAHAQLLIAERWAIRERRAMLGSAPGVERRNVARCSLPPLARSGTRLPS